MPMDAALWQEASIVRRDLQRQDAEGARQLLQRRWEAERARQQKDEVGSRASEATSGGGGKQSEREWTCVPRLRTSFICSAFLAQLHYNSTQVVDPFKFRKKARHLCNYHNCSLQLDWYRLCFHCWRNLFWFPRIFECDELV
jgi:hypothetical protein